MMLIAQDEGDAAMEAALTASLRNHMATLQRQGLDPEEVRWIQALIDMLAGGDPTPFIELLPGAIDAGNFNVTSLRRVWVFRRLHGDPRFEAIVDDQLAQLAAVREITDAITLPGL